MNELALFAGTGGGILASKLLGWQTVCAVERDAFAASVLAQRQNDGLLPLFPIWSDVQTFDGKAWRGHIDMVSGGFPCQDISSAGKGAGIEGERSGLWSEFARIIGEVRPEYAFIENSPNLTVRGLNRVLCDLASLGYDARWCVLGGSHFDAPHHRNRIWVLARQQRLFSHTQYHGIGWRFKQSQGVGKKNVVANANCCIGKQRGGRLAGWSKHCCGCETNVAYTNMLGSHSRNKSTRWKTRSNTYRSSFGSRLELQKQNVPHTHQQRFRQRLPKRWNKMAEQRDQTKWSQSPLAFKRLHQGISHSAKLQSDVGNHYRYYGGTYSQQFGSATGKRWGAWPAEPELGRVADGVANRVDRIKAIGNGQIPRVAASAFLLLYKQLTGVNYDYQ